MAIQGYCAIILPEQDEWQGCFINDDVVSDEAVERLRALAEVAVGTDTRAYSGALESTVVHGYVHQQPHLVAAACRALIKLHDKKFFYIRGHFIGEMTSTEFISLSARTVYDARREIDALPDVVQIKRRLLARRARPPH